MALSLKKVKDFYNNLSFNTSQKLAQVASNPRLNKVANTFQSTTQPAVNYLKTAPQARIGQALQKTPEVRPFGKYTEQLAPGLVYGPQLAQSFGRTMERAWSPRVAVQQYKKSPVMTGLEDIGNIPGFNAVVAATPFLAGMAKVKFDAKKVKLATSSIERLGKVARNIDYLQPASKMSAYTLADDLMKRFLPGMAKNPEVKIMAQREPDKWLKLVSTYLDDQLIKARNPELKLGFSTDAVKRRGAQDTLYDTEARLKKLVEAPGIGEKLPNKLKGTYRFESVNINKIRLGASPDSPESIKSAMSAIREGKRLPPITVKAEVSNTGPMGEPETLYEVIDGNHRLSAYQKMGVKDIPILVKQSDTGSKITNPQDFFNVSQQPLSPQVSKGVEVKPKVVTPQPKIVQPTLQKIGSRSVRRNPASDVIISRPEIKQEVRSFIKKDLKPGDKVNFLDYLRTPDRVLRKVGLGKEAELLKQKYRDYKLDLPKEISKITSWYNELGGSKDSSKRIFQFLDGEQVALNPTEVKVANEVKNYLKVWADKLGLPEDKQIKNYITHLFEDQLIQKEFDPELAKLIEQSGVPGSVYDPFLQKRYGIGGYKQDVFEALDAYVKRATRKFHMDQALGPLKKASEDLDVESEKYVRRLGEKINLRPSEVDNLIDNLIKSVPKVGYKFGQRPVANITRKIRQAVYRGTLGLNIGSATRNLTQGVNTYAKLGEKYTIKGYLDLARKGTKELKDLGLLSDDIIQDRTLSATKKTLQALDEKLWIFFDWAEKINRGAAFHGAKAKALANGATNDDAVKQAIKAVEDTQFTFGSVDTPVALQGDLVKFFTQFQSYNVKQAEFLAEMVKNKEFGGMIRYIGANLVLLYTVGNLFGMKPQDMLPFNDIFSDKSRFGQTPPIQLIKGLGQMALGGETGKETGIETIKKTLPAFIPAGVQAKKTIEGIKAYKQGASITPGGNTRFEFEKTPLNAVKSSIFGQYSLPGAKEYFANLGKSKTEIYMKDFDKLEREQKLESLKKLKKESPTLFSKVKRELKDRKLGVTEKEQKMRTWDVDARARYIQGAMDKMSRDEKLEYLKDLKTKGILTDAVIKELKALKIKQ